MFWRKKVNTKDVKEEYLVTFYFSSGESMILSSTKIELERIVKCVSENWNASRMADLDYGINFSHVTHYIVKPK